MNINLGFLITIYSDHPNEKTLTHFYEPFRTSNGRMRTSSIAKHKFCTVTMSAKGQRGHNESWWEFKETAVLAM